MGGAVFGCGGFEVGVFAPARWTWESTTHWSSLIWPLGRPRTAANCEYSPFTLTSWVPLCLPLRPSLVTFLGSYVCSRSGHILEIDHQRMAVRHTRCLLPMQTPGSPLPQKQTFSSGMWPSLCWGTSPDAFADASFPPGPGIAISSLSVSQAACAVGSEDGYLRLWPLDFSSVLLEAGGAQTAPHYRGHQGRAMTLGHPWADWQSWDSERLRLEPEHHRC